MAMQLSIKKEKKKMPLRLIPRGAEMGKDIERGS